MNTFTVGQCLSFGWRTFKMRPWFFILLPLVLVAVAFLVGIVQAIVVAILGKTFGGFVSLLISIALNTLIGMGVVSVYLKAHDAPASAKLADLWNPKPFGSFLFANILMMVGVAIGTLLLIVPGIIAALAFAFTQYIVIGEGKGAVASIKESMRITKGNRLKILLLILAIIGINLLGMIALLVGVFVSIPVSVLATVHAYRELSKQPLQAAVPQPAPVGTAF